MASRENDATDLNILYWNIAPTIKLAWNVMNLKINTNNPIRNDEPMRAPYIHAIQPSVTPALPGVVGIIIITINSTWAA